MQDRVVVIYSVDYLPDSGRSSETNISPKRQGGCRWGPEHKEELPGSPVLSTEGWSIREVLRTGSSSTRSNSQCRPVGAWGRVSYGMRVALLKASEIVRTARQEQQLATER